MRKRNQSSGGTRSVSPPLLAHDTAFDCSKRHAGRRGMRWMERKRDGTGGGVLVERWL